MQPKPVYGASSGPTSLAKQNRDPICHTAHKCRSEAKFAVGSLWKLFHMAAFIDLNSQVTNRSNGVCHITEASGLS